MNDTLKGNRMLQMKKSVLASAVVLAIAGLTTLLVSGALLTSVTVKTSGILASASLGVYADSACTQNLGPISWGTVAPGGSATKTFYLKNLGSVPVTLSLTVTNWNPTTANGPISLTWNREGATLSANQVTVATLTLSVSSSAGSFTTFSADAVVTGTG